jgi:hypothetical protein
VIGAFAVGIAQALKLVVDDDRTGPYIANEAGGFVVTILVGCGLLFFAAFAGVCLGFILPASWFQPPEPATSSPENAKA